MVITTAAPAWAAQHAGSAGSIPPINWWRWDTHAPPMGWFFVNFVLFLWGLTQAAGKPLRRTCRSRHKVIKAGLADSAAAFAAAQAARAAAQVRLGQCDRESAELEAAGKAAGERERLALVAEAEAQVQAMRADAEQGRAQDEARLQARLRVRLAAGVLARARGLLESRMDAATQSRLIDQALDALESLPATSSAAKGPAPHKESP